MSRPSSPSLTQASVSTNLSLRSLHSTSTKSPSFSANVVNTDTSPISTPYKLFIFDTGTTGVHPDQDRMHALTIREFLDPRSRSQDDEPALFTALISTSTKYPHHSFSAVWRQAVVFVSSHAAGETPLLLAHNAPFDAAFVCAELNRAGMEPPKTWRISCTLTLARSKLPIGADCTQATLARRYDVPVIKEHHAEFDTRVLSNIIVAMENDLEGGVLDTLEAEGKTIKEMANLYPYFHDLSSDEQEYQSENEGTRYYETKTGKLYHQNRNCQALRFAHTITSVEIPREGLEPCMKCVTTYVERSSAVAPSTPSRSEQTVETHEQESPTSVYASRTLFSSSPFPSPSPTSTQGHGFSSTKPGNMSSSYITTRTGRLFHSRSDCISLSSARGLYTLDDVSEERRKYLSPCMRCVNEFKTSTETNEDASRPVGYTAKSRHPGVRLKTDGQNDTNIVYVTRTGKYFHGSPTCHFLRRATSISPIDVYQVNSALTACPRCVSFIPPTREEKEERVVRIPSTSFSDDKDSDDDKGLHGREVTRRQSIFNDYGPFVRTKHGKKYHDKGCRVVRKKTNIENCAFSDGLEPCRVCLPNLFVMWQAS